jgi:phosphomannomutase
MTVNPSIFRSYDIRGIYPDELDEKTAHEIGRAFAVYLLETETERPKKIVVGRDMRLSSKVISRSFIEGVIKEGLNVLNIGEATVDMVYFASAYFHLPAAMITASHNPKEWNGFKLMKKDDELIGEDSGLEEIKKIAIEKNWSRQIEGIEKGTEMEQGTVVEQLIDSEYISHVLNLIDINDLRPMRVVIDTASGAVGPIIKKILEKLPVEYTPLYFNPDGDFPYHGPNPSLAENLESLKEELMMRHYHFGCAFDGDGDRIVFIDEMGEVINSGIIGSIFARYLLNQNPFGKVIYSATVSRILPDVVDTYGGQPVRERVGHTFIERRLKNEDGILGVETSGHYYFKKNFYVDSGIVAFVIMLEILSRTKKSLSVLVAELSKYVSIPEINFKIDNPSEFIKKIAQNFEGYDIDWLDGLTVRTNDFWLNLRLSNTEPLIRLNIEAKDELILGRIKKNLISLIEKEKTTL